MSFRFKTILSFLLFISFLFTVDLHPEDSKAEWTVRREVGFQTAWGFFEDGFTRVQPYTELGARYDPACPEKSEILIYYDFAFRVSYEATKNQARIEPRSILYSRTSESVLLKVGVQEVSWGETFGFFIADIVNPRDLTDPLFNELEWIRIPTTMVNYQYLSDPLNVQIIVIPIPENNLFPQQGDPFDLVPPADFFIPLLEPNALNKGTLLASTEFAFRLNHLFKSGVDLSLFYFRHYNRNIVYRFVPHHESIIAIQPYVKKINTFGCTFTKAHDDFVIRGDMVYHLRTPLNIDVFGFPDLVNLWQSILGIDRTFESDLTLGGQYHLDAWPSDCLHALSGLISKSFKNGEWDLEMFIYKGLNTRDCWVQPKVTWNGPKGWSISAQTDFLWGSTTHQDLRDGILGPVRNKDRIFVWIRREW